MQGPGSNLGTASINSVGYVAGTLSTAECGLDGLCTTRPNLQIHYLKITNVLSFFIFLFLSYFSFYLSPLFFSLTSLFCFSFLFSFFLLSLSLLSLPPISSKWAQWGSKWSHLLTSSALLLGSCLFVSMALLWLPRESFCFPQAKDCVEICCCQQPRLAHLCLPKGEGPWEKY